VPDPIEPRDAALMCAQIAYDKKADDIVILDVSKLIVITDFFVIATGDTRKQLQAIADGIHEKLKPLKVRRFGTEGYEDGRWILIDYGDVVVQLFDRDTRGYYNLEMIWGDAPRLPFTPKRAAEPVNPPPAPRPPPEPSA
jgi:ribosome-associated protein